MSLSLDLDLISAQKTVTAAGTAEPLAIGHPDEMRTQLLIIKALTTNAGKIYVSNGTVSSTTGLDLDPGDVVTYEIEPEEWVNGVTINMAKIWIDSDNNGEGVVYQYRRE